MAIKRGVSLYSYQQEQFFGQMDWKAQIREVHDNLHTDGIEIINESVIPQYPFPSEVFIADWNDYTDDPGKLGAEDRRTGFC